MENTGFLESYRFTFTEEENKEIFRLQTHRSLIKTIFIGIVAVAVMVSIIANGTQDAVDGFVLGMELVALLYLALSWIRACRNYSLTSSRICATVYCYELFADYMNIHIFRNDEKVGFRKFYYVDIQRKLDLGKYYLLVFDNQVFIIKKQEIAENSIFHSIKPKESEKPSAALKFLSVLLLVLSIVSGVSGFICASVQLFSMGTIKWWYLLAFSVIPLASFILGIYMKKYGGGRGNLFAGLFVLVIIFTLFFSVSTKEPVDAEKDSQIEAVESYMGIFLPEPYSYDNFKSSVNGIDYEDTAMQFHSKEGDFIEGIIKDNDKWSAVLTDEIYELVFEVGTAEEWDYVCVYNITNDEYNKMPLKEGTYDMAAMYYDMEYNGLYVIEYEYAK